jgi:hypothetical protein
VEENTHIIATFGGHVKESAIFFTCHRDAQRKRKIRSGLWRCQRFGNLFGICFSSRPLTARDFEALYNAAF